MGFPLEIAAKGMDIIVENGQTSYKEEQTQILNAFVENEDLDSTPPEEHPLYTETNLKLRSWFAGHLLRRAATGIDGETETGHPIWNRIMTCLQADVYRKTMDWHLQ